MEVVEASANRDPTTRVRGAATVRFGDCLTVRSFKIIDGGRDGRFLSPPARRIGEQWIPFVELSPELSARVLEAIERRLDGREA